MQAIRICRSTASNFLFNKSSFSQLRQLSVDANLKTKLDDIVKKNKVVVFMKGVPDAPKCGFSNAVSQVLRMHGVAYDSHDVLADENLRQGIKDYSNWPTIPQVYVDGEFVGGCDIIIQMHRSGELIELLEKVGIKSALIEQKGNEK
ncbi:Glutaredoxin-related protein 5, mitochondrial [Halotydeus destructor]|nr:Glutaredoxin-related protein 5, mitochondrial [Halotydeus destructor]